jgi:hypothetical protein
LRKNVILMIIFKNQNEFIMSFLRLPRRPRDSTALSLAGCLLALQIAYYQRGRVEDIERAFARLIKMKLCSRTHRAYVAAFTPEQILQFERVQEGG